MSTCNIKIYRTQLTPSRNALVDNLEGYLGNSASLVYSNAFFQYQQLGLDLTIKVNVPQSKITESGIGNYVRIEQDNRIWYYFILGATWKGTKTVQLTLSIDSINTFRNDLHWTDKTTIVRQHGDRFYLQYNNEFIRRIDEEGEGIAAEKYRTSITNVVDENTASSSLRWYLIYRTRDSLSPEDLSDPIACYLCADEQLLIKPASGSSVTLGAEELVAGNFYYFNYLDNPGGRVTISGYTYELGKTYQVCTNISQGGYTYENRSLRGIALYKQSGKIHWAFQWDNSVAMFAGADPFASQRLVMTAPGRISTSNKIDPLKAISGNLPFNAANTVDSVTVETGNLWRYGPTLFWVAEQSLVYVDSLYYTTAGQPQLVLNSIDSIDRTDSRLMKILELPYAPCEVIILNGVYTFPDEWTFEGGMMRLTQFNKGFSNYIGKIGLGQLKIGALIPDHRNERWAPKDEIDIQRESKLFHSDFYTYKAVYDSFAKEIQLEKIKPFLERGVYEDSETYIPVYFKPTNTINSKMAFKFDTQHLSGYADFARYEHNEDYGDYLLISRNNEMPIYSNDYVNYIRTGYNYDLKAQELAKQQALTNIVIESASTIASMVSGGAGFAMKALNTARNMFQQEWGHSAKELMQVDPSMYRNEKEAIGSEIMNAAKAQTTSPYLTAQAISSAAGLAKSIANLYFSQAQATNEREAKMATLAAQSTSVAGSDDIDLLNYYNGNKLQLITYNTKNYQKEAIADLFHYCGYNHPHMEYPDTTSRLWFNYIQCEPTFREEAYSPFHNYIEDIKTRYAAGVTVYHCNNNSWDWDQEYENWEVAVYPELSYISNDSIRGMKAIELSNGHYQISFDYLGKQYLNGSSSGDDNFIVIELLNMYDEVIFERQVTAYPTEHKSTTTGDFYEAPTQLRYKITYLDKETEWQTISLAGG